MRLNSCLAALAIACAPVVASAAVVYTDDFNTAASANNYNVYVTNTSGGTPSSDATFAYDYSALGIPAAPHTTDGSTVGLRLRADNLGNASGVSLGAVSVVSKALALPAAGYSVSADVWGNYIGGSNIGSSGSNGSTAAGMGVGTKGTGLQSPNGNDGFFVETFHDGGGGSNLDYRAYADNTRLHPESTSYWAAGANSTSAGTHTNSYYSFLTSHSAPTLQQTNYPSTQTGTTPVGIIGFAWHTMDLTNDGTNITWSIDGHTITTVPVSAVTLAGGEISLDAADSTTSGQTAANNQLLNADIWDNLTVSTIAVPEPASLSLLGLGFVGLLSRRRQA